MVNLLPNPTFAEGNYRQDNIPELGVPIGWRVSYKDNPSAPFLNTLPGEESPSALARPEVVTWPWTDAPENERELYYGPKLSDTPLRYTYSHVVKLFKPWLGMWAGLWAPGLTLQPNTYTFSVELFPKFVKEDGALLDDPATRSADYLRHVHYRLFGGSNDSAWMDGLSLPNGQWNTLSIDFTLSTVKTLGVGFEVAALFGLQDNCLFIRNPRLTAHNVPTPIPTPSPDPGPIDMDLPLPNPSHVFMLRRVAQVIRAAGNELTFLSDVIDGLAVQMRDP